MFKKMDSEQQKQQPLSWLLVSCKRARCCFLLCGFRTFECTVSIAEEDLSPCILMFERFCGTAAQKR